MKRARQTIVFRRAADSRDWPSLARAAIQAVHASLPPETCLKARMAAIDAAYPFGERRHYPYKIWCRERRRYLIPFGYVPQNAEPAPLLRKMQETES